MPRLSYRPVASKAPSIKSPYLRRRQSVVGPPCMDALEQRQLLCDDALIPIADNPKYLPVTVLNTPEKIASFLASSVSISPTPMTRDPVDYSGNYPTGDASIASQISLAGGGEQSVASTVKGSNGSTTHSASLDGGGHGTADVAPIVWVNRGITSGSSNDRFNDVFGANANAARAVMDAAINMWARVIGNFNYASPFTGQSYQLTVKMATGSSGNGAAASVTSYAGIKPISGAVTMGSGGDGLGSGWFVDSTPYDNSEFMGTIDNAFAMETQSGSAAAGKGDFLTVALAEMAHCMGLYTAPSGLQNVVTNTGVNDAAGGSSGAKLFVEGSANVKHLMTAFNSGSPQNFNAAIHTAEPQSLTFNGTTYNGTDDAGNAYYSFSQRCLVPEDLRLIFNDALGYSTVAASTFATAYATLDSSGVLQLRGGAGASSDVIAISVSGTDLVIDVDVSADVAGSGSLPGAGNLGSWRTIIPLSSINSINIQGGDGNDFLRVEGNGGKTVNINGGTGDDYFDFDYYSRNLGNTISGSINVAGGDGTGDHVWVYDDGVTTAQTYNITSSRFDRPGWAGFFYGSDIEGLTLTTSTAADTVNVPSTYVNQPIFLYSGGGADTVNIGSTVAGVGLQSINASVYVYNSPYFTTLNLLEGTDTIARNGTIGFSGTSLEVLNGVAPAPIYWNRPDITSVNLTMGSALDSLHVYDNSSTLNIHNTGMQDSVIIGDDYFNFPPLIFGNGLDDSTGLITIDNAPSFTNVIITDIYGSAARTATWASDGTYTTITGLQPAGYIRYKNNDTLSVVVRGGNYADSFTLPDVIRATTINSGGGNDTVTLNGDASGSTFTTDTSAGDDTININENPASAPAYVTTGDGTGDVLNINADGSGSASARLTASDEVATLVIGAGGLLAIQPGRDKALAVNLSATITGVLDLTDNAYIRRNNVPEAYYRTRLINGRNGGTWNGTSTAVVSSTVAASAAADSVGYGYAGTDFPLTSLASLTVNAGDLILRAALNGDTNLDGAVDFTDLLTLAQNYGSTNRRWSQGDFDYDSAVAFPDLLSLAQNYGASFIAAQPGAALVAAKAAVGTQKRALSDVSKLVDDAL